MRTTLALILLCSAAAHAQAPASRDEAEAIIAAAPVIAVVKWTGGGSRCMSSHQAWAITETDVAVRGAAPFRASASVGATYQSLRWGRPAYLVAGLEKLPAPVMVENGRDDCMGRRGTMKPVDGKLLAFVSAPDLESAKAYAAALAAR